MGIRYPIELAQPLIRDGWTRGKVIMALNDQIKRSQSTLAWRKAHDKQNSFDINLEHDIKVMALAICFLVPEEGRRLDDTVS